MQKFTNPLDKIKIASPCSANWNEMYGNERQRFCSECKLNVYNLSDMTRQEAERFLINSENRVCLRVFRRRDGTVLTQDCPVGWLALKKRASRASAAAMAMILTVFSGILGVRLFETIQGKIYKLNNKPSPKISFYISDGILENLPELKLEIIKNRHERD